MSLDPSPMQWDNDQQKLFNRRTALLAGGKFLLLSGLVGRMYYLQVVQSQRYVMLADENRINLRLLAPPRGQITDRYGRVLAVNKQNYQIILVPELTTDLENTLDALNTLVPISDSARTRIRRDVSRRRGFVPLTIRENLSWEDVARIEVNAPDLPGIMIDVGQTRYYPNNDEAAHLLGYVSVVSENDLGGDPLLELPGFRIGKAGIEKVHELVLRGVGGNSQVEVNAFGRVIRELTRQEGQRGAEVSLTIDLEHQAMIRKTLGEKSAAVVVLDIHSGEVLAMVSTPGYDPNAFNRGLTTEEWDALRNNEMAPLINKAISGQYSPGSTFKMMVALAALKKGVITPYSKSFCTGSFELGDSKFHCWNKTGHGSLRLHEAIAQSCDVFFYETALKTGIDNIAAMANRFGLGTVLGIDLPGERGGLIPTRAWKKKARGASWHLGETVVAGIGQGAVLTTPLQLAVMMARLVNGGIAIEPRLTQQITGERAALGQKKPAETIGIKNDHLNLIIEAMSAVVNSPTGTAIKSRIESPGFEMGGKTGTVQVRRITKAEREQGIRKNEDRPWKDRDHALFVGFAPIDAPRYAVAVVVEHGGGGSSTAAPIGRDVLLDIQRRDARLRSAGRADDQSPPTRQRG